MRVDSFIEIFSGYFTGVPDSQLSAVCDFLIEKYGISANHIVSANEGNAAAIAAGWHLSTGKIPVARESILRKIFPVEDKSTKSSVLRVA